MCGFHQQHAWFARNDLHGKVGLMKAAAAGGVWPTASLRVADERYDGFCPRCLGEGMEAERLRSESCAECDNDPGTHERYRQCDRHKVQEGEGSANHTCLCQPVGLCATGSKLNLPITRAGLSTPCGRKIQSKPQSPEKSMNLRRVKMSERMIFSPAAREHVHDGNEFGIHVLVLACFPCFFFCVINLLYRCASCSTICTRHLHAACPSKKQPHFLVLMTVDSTNDMPTLKKANVGIAAGLTGDCVNDAPNVGIVVEGSTGHRVPGGFVAKFR